MIRYIDGFALSPPRDRVDHYRRIADPSNPVFDSTRMAYGGFRSLVHSALAQAQAGSRSS